MSLNAIVSSLSYLPPTPPERLPSATGGAGRRRQHRFPRLSNTRRNGGGGGGGGGGREQGATELDRQCRQACVFPFCISVRLTEVRTRAYVSVCGDESGGEETGAAHLGKNKHGGVKDFPCRVSRASYCPCALEIT